MLLEFLVLTNHLPNGVKDPMELWAEVLISSRYICTRVALLIYRGTTFCNTYKEFKILNKNPRRNFETVPLNSGKVNVRVIMDYKYRMDLPMLRPWKLPWKERTDNCLP
jgi:hypothetical protein